MVTTMSIKRDYTSEIHPIDSATVELHLLPYRLEREQAKSIEPDQPRPANGWAKILIEALTAP